MKKAFPPHECGFAIIELTLLLTIVAGIFAVTQLSGEVQDLRSRATVDSGYIGGSANTIGNSGAKSVCTRQQKDDCIYGIDDKKPGCVCKSKPEVNLPTQKPDSPPKTCNKQKRDQCRQLCIPTETGGVCPDDTNYGEELNRPRDPGDPFAGVRGQVGTTPLNCAGEDEEIVRSSRYESGAKKACCRNLNESGCVFEDGMMRCTCTSKQEDVFAKKDGSGGFFTVGGMIPSIIQVAQNIIGGGMFGPGGFLPIFGNNFKPPAPVNPSQPALKSCCFYEFSERCNPVVSFSERGLEEKFWGKFADCSRQNGPGSSVSLNLHVCKFQKTDTKCVTSALPNPASENIPGIPVTQENLTAGSDCTEKYGGQCTPVEFCQQTIANAPDGICGSPNQVCCDLGEKAPPLDPRPPAPGPNCSWKETCDLSTCTGDDSGQNFACSGNWCCKVEYISQENSNVNSLSVLDRIGFFIKSLF